MPRPRLSLRRKDGPYCVAPKLRIAAKGGKVQMRLYARHATVPERKEEKERRKTEEMRVSPFACASWEGQRVKVTSTLCGITMDGMAGVFVAIYGSL